MYAPDHKRKDSRDVMYRSNSSLDLIYGEQPSGNGLRREYGSHGSIDVIGGDRHANMVHNYNVVGTAEKPPGINRTVDRLSDVIAADHADGPTPRSNSSPKPRLKLNKLWGGAGHQLARQTLDDQALTSVTEGAKRQQFAHYDCQSLMANLSYAAEIRGTLLSRRRNTTTGASAASLLATRGLPPGEDTLPDIGDGRSNEMLESCPFFRNELGGEEERCVSLCQRTARGPIGSPSSDWHRPRAAYGLSVLEPAAGHSHWRHGCPFARSHNPLPVETQDQGALYYRNYFYGQPHQNWFGMDDTLGPIAISIKKERVELRRGSTDAAAPASQLAWQYRLIVRTSELLTLRGSLLEDAIPMIKPSNNSATYNTKDVIEYVAPELQLSCLRLGLTNSGAEEQLLRLDEQCVTRHYKVGVMYCRAGQSTEEEMYNNQEAGPAFVEFLQTLGHTVRLKDFDKYKAGLDNRTDSTGLYSVYTTYQGCEIMFHVSTMLPYTPNNRQQLLRKRHIGNDIVTIVFQEPGAAPFTPRNIRSQFQHVFVVVRAIDPCTENTHYSIAVSRAKEVPLFGPPIKEGAVYPKGDTFTDLLLSKVINGENAAIQSPKFSTMATRTRQEYLKDLARNYVTTNTLETGQKFSIFSSLLMKSSNSSNNTVLPRQDNPNMQALVGGALCYHVQVEDEGAGRSLLECVMGVSADTAVLVDAASRQLVLVLPTNSLLGWTINGDWIRIYYHRGESFRIYSVHNQASLSRRLASVAPPNAQSLAETTLERGPHKQLGFQVSAEGVVRGVEAGGAAARAGLRRGARLLEVCGAAVRALMHDQLLDLLAADPVTVTLTFASSTRCECESQEQSQELPVVTRATQQTRRASPPRSDSEGYGTGSSGRSARRSTQASPAAEPASRRQHNSLTPGLREELLRLMESELSGAPRGDAALPLPDAASLDWQTLVHTATAAVLQICDEHQYPSMDNADPSLETVGSDSAHDSWSDLPSDIPSLPTRSTTTPNSHNGTPSKLNGPYSHQNGPIPSLNTPRTLQNGTIGPPTHQTATTGHQNGSTSQTVENSGSCGCGLAAKVAALETENAAAHRHHQQLEDEVRRLRRHNARLREESARAVWQLRHFTQWLKRTVDRQ